MHYLIKDLNQDEKPREKLEKFGASNLTDSELLAILLRSGGKDVSAVVLAKQILSKFGNISDLISTDINQLAQIKHIDKAKASSILAAVELGVRLNSKPDSTNIAIKKPEDIFNLLKKDFYGKTREILYLISLNSRNRFIAKDIISMGTVNETLLSPREIFRQALLRNAVGIVLAHNHPSNDPSPSEDDIKSTKRVSQTAKETGLIFLDHIIIVENAFYSMKSTGVLKNLI